MIDNGHDIPCERHLRPNVKDILVCNLPRTSGCLKCQVERLLDLKDWLSELNRDLLNFEVTAEEAAREVRAKADELFGGW